MEELASWIRSKLGCGYVYGATGWICTQACLEQQAKQYPQYADTILTVCRKWIGVQCFDCAQLIRQGLRARGISIPSGTTSQWNADIWTRKGPAAQRPEGLCVLYRGDGKTMQHAGWYMGEGTVIDARGSAYGVVQSAQADYPWTHYAIPKGLEETVMDALYRAIVQTQRDPLRVRETPQDGRILGQIPKGAEVEVLSEAQSGWPMIRYGSLTGYVSGEYLRRIPDKADGDPDEEMGEETGAYLLLTDGTGRTWRPEGGFRAELRA